MHPPKVPNAIYKKMIECLLILLTFVKWRSQQPENTSVENDWLLTANIRKMMAG